MTKSYHIPHEAWINGVLKRGGSKIDLTDDEAKYLLMSGTVEHTKERIADEAAEAKAKKDKPVGFEPKTTVG